MENSFISKVQVFLEEKNMPFEEIPIKLNFMPNSFHYAIKAEIYDSEKIYKQRKGLEYFYICRDLEGNTYIKAYDDNKNLGVNIYQNNIIYQGKRQRGLKINENSFLNIASRIEYDLTRIEFMRHRIPVSYIEEITCNQRKNYLIDEYSYFIIKYLTYLNDLYDESKKSKQKSKKNI